MARPGLMQHRKFRRLVRALGSAMVARGVLELLWDPCYESGDDYVGTATDVEALVGWTGESGVLVRALVDAGAPEGAGFLEVADPGDHTTQPTYRVHDLWHHAPEYVTKRHKRELERKQRHAPTAERRRSAPNGRRRPPTPDRQIGNDGAPAPAPALAPAPAPTHTESTGTLARPSAHELKDVWNAGVTKPIAQCREFTDARRKKAQARLKEEPVLDVWVTVIGRINASAFCRGETDRGNWIADFDWLLKPDTRVRVLEGKYDNRTRAAPAIPTVLLVDWRSECRDVHGDRCGSATFHAAQMAEDAEKRSA